MSELFSQAQSCAAPLRNLFRYELATSRHRFRVSSLHFRDPVGSCCFFHFFPVLLNALRRRFFPLLNPNQGEVKKMWLNPGKVCFRWPKPVKMAFRLNRKQALFRCFSNSCRIGPSLTENFGKCRTGVRTLSNRRLEPYTQGSNSTNQVDTRLTGRGAHSDPCFWGIWWF